jgi:hypothetical protein
LKQFKKLSLIQAAIIFVGTFILLFFEAERAAVLSYFVGTTIVLLNYLFLAFLWKCITEKKLIALGLIGIVLKYALLVVALVALSNFLRLEWVLIGLSSLILSSVSTALIRVPERIPKSS